MAFPPLSISRRRAKRSSALVITLAVLVIVSALMLVFFNQSTLNRQLASSSAEAFRADTLAHSALDTIVGDLRTEIAAGSGNSIEGFPATVNGVTVYVPTANFTAVPSLVLPNAAYQANFPNLIKQSTSGSSFWANPAGGTTYYDSAIISPVRSAPGNSTATASLNSRSINPNRWNAPGLLCDPGPGTATNTTTYSTPPDWVLVTREGVITNAPTQVPGWDPSLADQTVTNQKYVIGRYAYAIYNEGGLLDINVAGFPSSLNTDNPTFVSKRGLLPQVDLANLLRNTPTINDANATADSDSLVTFRNAATASSEALYTNYASNATNGFTSVAGIGWQITRASDGANFTVPFPGDQTFVGRQDLINFVKNKANGNNIPTAALQYLGTFSREVDAPSYTPPLTATTDTSANPSLVNIRDLTGQPLLKKRFPLSRLTLLTSTATSTNTSDIYKYFGLIRSDSSQPWVYNHGGDGTHILTLAEIAPLGRDPDFFETLQAAITSKSLGKTLLAPSSLNDAGVAFQNANDSSTGMQILQIGADLIDQVKADSYPTRISASFIPVRPGEPLNSPWPWVAGTEDLPYLTRVFESYYREQANGTGSDGTPAIRPFLGCWLLPEVWNPYQNASINTAMRPTNFKFVGYTPGTCYFTAWQDNSQLVGSTGYDSGSLAQSQPAVTFSLSDPGVPFTDTSGLTFSTNPTLVMNHTSTFPSGTASASGSNFFSDSGASITGLYVGVANTVVQWLNPSDTSALYNYNWACLIPSPSVNFYLEYQDPSGNWIPYDKFENQANALNASESSWAPTAAQSSYFASHQAYPSGTQTDAYCTYYDVTPGSINPNPDQLSRWTASNFLARGDPRTDRFGAKGSFTGGSYPANAFGSSIETSSMRPIQSNPGYFCFVGFYTFATGWTVGGAQASNAGPSVYFGALTENNTSSALQYKDPDGIMRPSDNAYGNGSVSTGYPLNTSNTTSRPIILHRPFQSVAEMGYAFRGAPWKSIDFSTSTSGDAALLDAFSVNDTTSETFIAGRVDLNTRQQPVIQALLTGVYTDEAHPLASGSITKAVAATIANDLTTMTSGTVAGQGPLLNRSELATRLCPLLSSAYNPTSNGFLKFRREAAIRALSDVGNTRTWNLLIDVIAQSGHYTSTSSNFNQFLVEGEARYWLHVAIDRYTGKIVDKYLEPIYE